MTDKVNRNDAEDCEACSDIENLCLYHEGQIAGERALARLIQRVLDDPEIVPAAPRDGDDGE